MTQLIKAISVYTAHLPELEVLANALAGSIFQPIEPNTAIRSSVGFVAFENDHIVRSFPGGLAFRLRCDNKLIPGKVIKAAVAEKVALIKEETGRKPGKKERKELKEVVIEELALQAFVNSTVVEIYYNPETNWLVIPTTQRKLADAAISALVYACESVKTETIHVSDVAMGLTTRLEQFLKGEEGAFGVFDPCGTVELAQDDRRLRVKMATLNQAAEGLQVALTQGFRVKQATLSHNGTTEFTLTDDLKVKGLAFSTKPTAEEADEHEDPWVPQVTLEFAETCAVMKDLIAMFSPKETPDAE
jgi:recombination associated protein RdgC